MAAAAHSLSPEIAVQVAAGVATPLDGGHARARRRKAIEDALPATSVITRADIERSAEPSTRIDCCRAKPAWSSRNRGGRGAPASLFMRGANSSQMLVLVDGVRINTWTSGAAGVGGIALDTIDRIEIVRGNLSSLYGLGSDRRRRADLHAPRCSDRVWR